MATQAIERKPIGRPPIPYDPEIAEEICLRIASGSESLNVVLSSDKRFPSLTAIARWLSSNDEFKSLYARAKMLQADMLGEGILDIADGEGQAHDKRIRIDARRWLMSKLNAPKFGDKLDVTSGGEKLPAPNSVTIDARVQSIMLLGEARRRAAALFEDD